MKPKVYLSKSKSGSFDDIVKTRQYCKELGFDLYEFEGGTYTTNKLDSCNYLLVLPPSLEEYPMTVGKGQYTEIHRFLKTKNPNNLYIVSNLKTGLAVDGLVSDVIHDINWKTEYAGLITNEIQIDITNFDIVKPNLISKRYWELSDKSYQETVINKNKPMLACVGLFK